MPDLDKSAPRAADRAERRMRWAFEGRPPRAAPQLAPRPAPQLAPQPAPERALVAFAAADVSGSRAPPDRRAEGGQGKKGTEGGEHGAHLVVFVGDDYVFGEIGEDFPEFGFVPGRVAGRTGKARDLLQRREVGDEWE